MNRIVSAYKKTPESVKASFWFVVASVVQRGISFLTTPIFTRLLTTDEYGKYTVYGSWYQIFTVFCTLNLSAGVFNNGMSKWPESRDELTSSMLGLSNTCTFCLLLVYLAFSDLLTDIFKMQPSFVICIFIECLFVPAYCFWAAKERYDYKYKKLVVVSVLMALMGPICGIFSVLTFSDKTSAMIFSFAGVQVIFGGIFLYLLYSKGKRFFNKDFWKYGLSFNIPLIPHYLSQIVFSNSDRIMISWMVDDGAAGIYSIAYAIGMVFVLVTTAINNSFIPFTYKSIKDGKYEDITKISSGLCTLVAASCIVVMCVGPEIVAVFGKSDYYEARWIILPLSASVFFQFLFPLFCNFEFYFEKTRFVVIASIVVTIMNLGLNYIFIDYYGYIAAAYATLLCYIILAIGHGVYFITLERKIGFARTYNIKYLILLSGIVLLLMLSLIVVYDYWAIRYLILSIIIFFSIVFREKIKDCIKMS